MVDLRQPNRDWKKHPPSLTALVALLSAAFLVGGACLALVPMIGANPLLAGDDAARAGHDSLDTLTNVFFGVGTALAAIFVLLYLLRLGDTDPRKGRYKSD